MSIKNTKCVITAAVSDNERKLFTAMARDLDVSCNVLMRRLIRYFLEKKISWNKLFTQSQKLPSADEAGITKKSYMRTQVKADQYAAFTRIAEEWGSTAAVVLRRLVSLYVAGEIERRDIW